MAVSHLIFSSTEFQRRWALARTAIEGHGADLAILTDPDTIFWLTGFSGTPTTFQALVVSADREPRHILRYAEASSVAASSFLADADYYNDWDDPIAETLDLARHMAPAAKQVGLEKMSTGLSAHRYESLLAGLPGVDPVDVSMPLGEIRLVKSDEEVEMFRRSARAIEAGMQAGIDVIHDGVTERDIAAGIAAELVRAGADSPLVGIIASGPRLGQVHGGLSDRALAPGDMIRLEGSNSVNRYWTRMMRMISIGEPTSEARNLYDSMRAAQDAQLAAMKPGAIPSELDAMARENLPSDMWAMQLSGYGLAFHERSVIGSEIDRYRLTRTEQRPLQAGMVLHVYLTWGEGVAISESVVVRDGGAERLTTMSRDWIVR